MTLLTIETATRVPFLVNRFALLIFDAPKIKDGKEQLRFEGVNIVKQFKII